MLNISGVKFLDAIRMQNAQVRHVRNMRAGMDVALDRTFRRVVDLLPRRQKDLDPVVLKGIVRGAYYDAGVKIEFARQVRDAGRRDDSRRFDRGPGGQSSGMECRLETAARLAGVAAGQKCRLSPELFCVSFCE